MRDETSGRTPQEAPVLARFAREVVLVTVLFVAYNVGRVVVAGDRADAFAAARDVWALERWLRLPSEQVVQALVLDAGTVVRVANGYYTWAHFPVTLAVLLWLFFRRPAHYLWARRALTLATFASLTLYVLLPVAPPRMMRSLGFVDTGELYGQSIYHGGTLSRWANQFAAMPSLHVGWAVLVAIVVVHGGRTGWRWLWLLHPTMTVAVVVVTANHYWLDGVAGTTIVVLGLAATRHVTARAASASTT